MCRKDERTHKHHIIPRYMGGPDTPENLVEVTVTQHAMFHFCNYQLWGNEEDRIAWRAISGQITLDEAKFEVMSLGGKKAQELGLGVHALTKEKKSENGKKGGTNTYERGVGVFARSKEQMIEDGRKGGKSSSRKRCRHSRTITRKNERGRQKSRKNNKFPEMAMHYYRTCYQLWRTYSLSK
jgi:general stress protein YciG